MNRKRRRAARTQNRAARQAGVSSGVDLARAFSTGVRYFQAGRLDDAEAALKSAVAHDPTHGKSWHLLGLIQIGKGNYEAALELLQRAVACAPDSGEAQNDLGAMLQIHGRLEEAAACYRRAIALMPNHAEACQNLGVTLYDLGQIEGAIACYRRALALDPNYVKAHVNLGAALRDEGLSEEAIACYRRALAIRPEYDLAQLGVINALLSQGRLEEAIRFYERAITLSANASDARGGMLFCLNFMDTITCEALFEAHKAWAIAHAPALGTLNRRYANRPDPKRRLRVGYVSPDFRAHSVGCFFEPLIRAHDHSEVEVFCYANVRRPDATTARLQQMVNHWRSILHMADESAAARIRADEIDILVDLAGHTRDNRLGIFARKPAPVQVTWLGYPNTTGLAAIDYRITDAVADPEGEADRLHSERLFRLPRLFLCYGAPPEAGPVTVLPARAAGFVTFGSFNNVSKVQPKTAKLWSRILHAVPGSRLVLKSQHLRDRTVRERYTELFGAEGITAARLDLLPWVAAPGDHIGLYGSIDIALDPLSYNGTTTTCEALWMGVPVVTLRGDRHASRVGASILNALGRNELIAGDEESYLACACSLAQDLDRLEALRAELRVRMQASPICDAAEFAREMEHAYRTMWRHWCEAHSS